jgi:uncharacterized membrane protein
MTPGLGFAFAAMLCFGLSDLLYKRGAASGIEPGRFLMGQAWVFCPSITLFAWLTGTLHLQASSLWAGAAALCSLVAFYNFARSLADGHISTIAPIFRLNFTITAALAIILLGESATLIKSIALLSALIAVWLLLSEPRGGQRAIKWGPIVRVLIAALAMGMANFFHKIGLIQGASPETMVAVQGWVFCSTVTLWVVVRDRGVKLGANSWRYAMPAGLTLVTGFVLLLHGLSAGFASVLVPVAQMGFVFTALVGFLLFGEPFGRRKIAGLLVAVIALGLFAAS